MTDEKRLTPEIVQRRVPEILSSAGFEAHPFKIGWYNKQVQKPFVLSYPNDTLAFIIISSPDVFENAFKPFVCRSECTGVKDPIDECMIHYFGLVKQAFPYEDVEMIHDFEMHHNRRPKILVQTAGHVAGAAYYYQRSDVEDDPWDKTKKIFGVSVHPKYGGWFALRGVIIFKNILHPSLEQTPPEDCVPTRELRIKLLERYNYHWQDWSFRDIIPAAKKYSEEQKLYFETLPKDRMILINQIRNQNNY